MNSSPETPQFDVDDVAAATFGATAQRCVEVDVVIVPVDGASLNLTDSPWDRTAGAGGAQSVAVRGVQVVTAIGLHPDGAPLGLLGQAWWARAEAPSLKQARDRDPEDKETWHWLRLLESTRELCFAFCCRPWFQFDQVGDAWPVLLTARYEDIYLTVRAAHNRRVVADHITEEPISLWPILAREQPLGTFTVGLPGSSGQQPRRAKVEVRTRPVTVKAKNKKTNRVHLIDVFAVYAREVGSPPGDEEPLEWMLLTNRPTEGFQDACAVVLAYTYRWTTEEIQRTWRAGGGLDQDTIHTFQGDSRTLAILLATLAVRARRLLWIIQEDPQRPANEEFSAAELDALLATRMRPDLGQDTLTVEQVTRWVAELGGSSKRAAASPPNPRSLSRGLELLTPLDSTVQELLRG